MKVKRERLLGFGLGAGAAGAMFLALRYAIRPPTKSRVPDSIAPAVFATRVFQTGYGPVVYHEAGEGVPMVFVHGVCPGASSYEWSKVYPHFAAGHRVLALDLLGFGESARSPRPVTAPDQARAIAEFVRGVCGGAAILVGSGLGGGFCAIAASEHPELARALVLLMPTGLADFGKHRLPWATRWLGRSRTLARFYYRNHRATGAGIRAMLASMGFADPSRLTDEAVEMYSTCAQQAGAEHAVNNLLSGRLSFDLEPRMRAIAHPVRLIWGEKAVYPPLEWAYRWQGMLSRSTLALIEGAGALAALERPEAVVAAIEGGLAAEPAVRGV
jgi:haloalkane dehalogenase